MLEKSCRWWPIWYLLFFCHGAEGQLQWVVKENVTAYGQNLILFCPVDNCCREPAGWFVGSKTIIIDVKTFSNDPKVKYHGTYNKDGFGVVIRNLSEADLNVTYRCIYGFDLSTPKYLLHGDVFRESQLQWVVKEKVTAYGQNLILFCSVDNCCREPAGWFVGSKTIIIDVKTFSNDPKAKYHETYNKDGFGVVIRNLSEADLNVTYRCIYGFDLSTPKYLLHGDVFRENVPDKDKEIDTAEIYKIVVPIAVIMVGFMIGLAYCVYTRIKKKRQKQTGTDEEMKVLHNSDIQMENQQDNPFLVHTVNQCSTNYARLDLVVFDIFPNILRDIMHHNIAPDVLYKSISEKQHSNPLFVGKMTHEERKSLNTLNNRTYDNIGFSTLYKLMRSFSILDVPTQGWGKQPTNADVTISDDVERLRNVRRKIVDRIKADIDLIEMNDYFSNIVNITQRIDTYFSKLPNQGFTREVLNSQTKCIDPDLEQKYYKVLKVIEDMKDFISKVIPTTFQQNQSAKEKPMKSNNENEANVSTIPQESDTSESIHQ